MKFQLYLWICFFQIQLLCAQTTAKALLWRIEGKDLPEPCYVYGTVHIQDGRVFEMANQQALPAIKNCSIFASELDMDSITGANSMKAMLLCFMKDGKTLKDIYTPKQYKNLEKIVETETGIKLSLFVRMKPIFISTLFSKNSFEKDKTEFLDQYLFNKAKEMGLQVIGLETMEEQIQAMDVLSEKEQADQLYKTAMSYRKKKSKAKMEEMNKKVLDQYINMDLEGMLKHSSTDKDMEKLNESLIFQRNKHMADRMLVYGRKKPIFIAVGAAHLGGEKGIITLLEKQGYTVSPVNPK